MSLKHVLALAGLVGVAACQNPMENQALCPWLDGIESNYPCAAEDPLDGRFPVAQPDWPRPDIRPRANDNR